MARLKKNKKNLFTQTFTYKGQRYFVRAKERGELSAKVEQKKKDIDAEISKKLTPTLDAYYQNFTEIRRAEVRESTIRAQRFQYELMAAVVVDGVRFGNMEITSIKTDVIEKVRKNLLKEGKTPEHLNICFAHLSHVLNKAVLDDTIEKNPCKALSRLKRASKPIGENRHRALSEDDVIAFLKASEDRNSYYHNVFKLMTLTGMRIGEVGALTLDDIDDHYIHIRRTITRNEASGFEVGTDAKTESGKRDIPLNAEINQVIRNQRDFNNMIFGFQWLSDDSDDKRLFRGVEGDVLKDYSVNREIARICKDIGIERFTCHALRVSFATRYIEQRPHDYKTLQEIMGHKDISITLNLYARVMDEKKIAAMQELKIKTS